MPWLQIVLMVLKLLKQAKSANSSEEFVSVVTTSESPLAANGDLLKWLWENRQAIVEFILTLLNAGNVPLGASGVESAEAAEARALIQELQQ